MLPAERRDVLETRDSHPLARLSYFALSAAGLLLGHLVVAPVALFRRDILNVRLDQYKLDLPE